MEEITKRGQAVYRQLRGNARARSMQKAMGATRDGTFGAAMTTLSMDFVFGRVWARDGLNRRDRSLVTLGILIALRQTDELRNHIRIGLTNGLTESELEEVLMQAAAYAGFPAAHAASEAATEIFNGLKGEQDTCAAD